MKVINKNNAFPVNAWFDRHFHGNFLFSESPLKDGMNKQKYPLGDKIISSRVLNHWYDMGIVTDDRPEGKGWKKFSLSEIIWLVIVKRLRNFGLDLQRIKQVKEQLDRYNSEENKSKCPLLDFYVVVAMTSTVPIKLIVFESGQAELVRQIDIDVGNMFQLIREDFISIDLNKLLNRLLNQEEIKADYLNYNVSPIAREVENALLIDDIISVTIKVKDKEYVMDKKYFTKDKIKAEALMSVLKFGELIEKKNNGKSTYQVTKPKKIKKKG